MSIEQDIQQKGFKNIHHKLLVNIIYTNSWIASEIGTLLKPYQLSTQQFYVLRTLKEIAPAAASTNYLITQMVHDNSNASRLVDKLITKGLAQRKQSTKDKRQVEVSITSKGEQLLYQIETTIQEWERSNEHLNQEDSLRLIELTQKLPNFSNTNQALTKN